MFLRFLPKTIEFSFSHAVSENGDTQKNFGDTFRKFTTGSCLLPLPQHYIVLSANGGNLHFLGALDIIIVLLYTFDIVLYTWTTCS